MADNNPVLCSHCDANSVIWKRRVGVDERHPEKVICGKEKAVQICIQFVQKKGMAIYKRHWKIIYKDQRTKSTTFLVHLE